MIWAFFSRRLRMWALFTVLLPLVGRVLGWLGAKVSRRNPQVGGAMLKAADYARPTTGRRRRLF